MGRLSCCKGVVRGPDVEAVSAADWEKAIMTGYEAWRQLRNHGGGQLELDLDAQTLSFLEP
ncbi:hypothetical protein ABZZ20_08230 [Streptomyces sp. NPDC006430]|uniref:hypothetical protein n=1 Tax=Streptomyces sp. NPDC006430 TaxID=3154299 RepID=UPI0033AFC4AF